MASREHHMKRSSSFFRGSTATLLSTPSSSQSQLFHAASSTQMLHQVTTPIPEHSEVHSVSEAIPAASEADASDAGFVSGTDKSKHRQIILLATVKQTPSFGAVDTGKGWHSQVCPCAIGASQPGIR